MESKIKTNFEMAMNLIGHHLNIDIEFIPVERWMPWTQCNAKEKLITKSKYNQIVHGTIRVLVVKGEAGRPKYRFGGWHCHLLLLVRSIKLRNILVLIIHIDAIFPTLIHRSIFSLKLSDSFAVESVWSLLWCVHHAHGTVDNRQHAQNEWKMFPQ